jgi:ATP-dependent DNA ligase
MPHLFQAFPPRWSLNRRVARLNDGGIAVPGTDARPNRDDPSGRGWTFEPKMDGYRALVCTHASLQVHSRRGWDMTHLLPESRRSLPEHVQLDGELVALADDGRPDFHRLGSRMLHGRGRIPLTGRGDEAEAEA